MKIAVLFDRIGPYHVARLRGAMDHAEILAIEGAPHRAVYDWVPPPLPPGLQHVVLAQRAGEESDPDVIESRLDDVVAPHAPDVLALPGWSNLVTLAALRWCRRRSIPALCMSETNGWDFRRRWLTETVKRGVVAHYGAGLATNASQIDYLVSLGLRRETIFSGYNVIDNDYFRAEAERWRAQQGLPAEIVGKVPLAAKGRYFLASNRFIAKKNLLRLIEAYALFRAGRGDDVADWPLVLLGDGELRPAIEERIGQLGLADFVHLPGFLQIDALVGYYGTAGAFVHASTTEQWGLVINEAMAAGLPVAASNRCGATEFLIEDGVTGFGFDPHDTRQIADTLQRIAALEPDLPLLQAARTRVDQLKPARFGESLAKAAICARTNPARPGLAARLTLDVLIAHAARSDRF